MRRRISPLAFGFSHAHVLYILKIVGAVYCLTIAALFGKNALNITEFLKDVDLASNYFFSVWFSVSVLRLLICKILRIS